MRNGRIGGEGRLVGIADVRAIEPGDICVAGIGGAGAGCNDIPIATGTPCRAGILPVVDRRRRRGQAADRQEKRQNHR